MLFLARPFFLCGLGFLFFTYAFFQYHQTRAQLHSVEQELSHQQQVLQEKKELLLKTAKFQKEVYKPYQKLKRQGVFHPTAAPILKKHLKYLLRSSRVHAHNLQVIFLTEESPSTLPHDLRLHEITLQFSAHSEVPLYRLLQDMEKNLPGLLQVKKFNIEKKGRRKVEGMMEVRVINVL